MVNRLKNSKVHCCVLDRDIPVVYDDEGDRCRNLWRFDRLSRPDVISISKTIQSLLILPQIIQIFKQGRVGGISYLLIFLNLLGDIIKMYYFVVKVSSFPFRINLFSSNCVEQYSYSSIPS